MKTVFVAVALACTTAFAATPVEWTRAEVIKVEPARSRVLLKHEEIRSIGMGAMTMPFKADPKVNLKGFKPGDQVRFTLAKGDHLVVDAMEKAR